MQKKLKTKRCKRCGVLFVIKKQNTYKIADGRTYTKKVCDSCESEPLSLTPEKLKKYQRLINDKRYVKQVIQNMAYTIVNQVYAQ